MKIIEQIVRVTTDGNETKAEVVGEVKHGKWKLNKDGNWACSFCDFDPYHDNMKGMNYCPNCGAKMDGKETNNA